MRILYLYILLIMFSLEINAGAPAPITSLPEPPYVFEKGTLITAEVDWNKDSIKKFISSDIKLDEVVNGGIEVFFTKHKKPLAKINYVLIWLNLQNDYDVMTISDLLITDISTVYVDYLLLDNPIYIINNPDPDPYMQRSSILRNIDLPTINDKKDIQNLIKKLSDGKIVNDNTKILKNKIFGDLNHSKIIEKIDKIFLEN